MGSEDPARLTDGQHLVIEFDESGCARFQRAHSPLVLTLERQLVWMERGHDLIQVWESAATDFEAFDYKLLEEHDPR
jgi:hypothetical protein